LRRFGEKRIFEVGEHLVESDERVRARAVVIASGVRYRRLATAGLGPFEAASVHYWVSPAEAKLCSGQEVALVGTGNSAGQAVVGKAFILRTMAISSLLNSNLEIPARL
jgi:thioredoxin reductase (NADPH)